MMNRIAFGYRSLLNAVDNATSGTSRQAARTEDTFGPATTQPTAPPAPAPEQAHVAAEPPAPVRELRYQVGERNIILTRGDIAAVTTDSVVTAANAKLRGGGGVDFVIHRQAGPELLKALRAWDGCPTGDAVATPAFDMEAQGVKHVIHAVGPIWSDGKRDDAALLASAYRASLQRAEELGCKSVALPSLSTGVYGYPPEDAAPIALRTVREFLANDARHLQDVTFVLFDRATTRAFVHAYRALRATP